MKRLIPILLIAVMLLGLVACGGGETPGGETPAQLKLGLGFVATAEATNATADTNGAGNMVVTVAAVLVDADGKIAQIKIDSVDLSAEYTADGKAVAAASLKTKLELGDEYGMKGENSWESKHEWYEHAAAFEAACVGKTVAAIAGLADEAGKPGEALSGAGCTINVADFVKAVDAAVKNATVTGATEKDTLKLGIATVQDTQDATADANGVNGFETTLFAAAVNAEGKMVAASMDTIAVEFAFDASGASKYDATVPVQSKKQLGDDYGMKGENPWESKHEWYEHAAAFEAACVGKTAAEAAGLADEAGKPGETLSGAGCTVNVAAFLQAVAKVA